MRKSGAEIVVECILEQGVETVFGIPGGWINPVFDALGLAQDRITHILTAHEQMAAHAADGYARASGKPGVCIATGGPGATNLCTGIAAAYMDSIPMVCVTGNVPSASVGTDSFQEVDIVGMTIPITKHNYQVGCVETISDTLREAFSIAVSGRPGPVLVDISTDALKDFTEYSAPLPKEDASPLPSRPTWTGADALLERLRQSEAPLILAGGGVLRSGAESRLVELAERLNAPVVTTLMGLGAISSSHPLNLGMIGLHGRKAANQAFGRADLLVAVGARFSDRSMTSVGESVGRLPLIHIDIDRAEIGKNYPAEHFIVADAKTGLDMLLRAEPKTCPFWREWLTSFPPSPSGPNAPQNYPERLIAELGRLAGPDALICTDVGQHQMWSAQHLLFEKPGHFLTSGGAGAMGFGLGAAIGAQCACPEKTVVLITGDGSLQMSLGSFATVARYHLPIVTVVANNGALGMIRQVQKAHYGGRYFSSDLDGAPDFAALAGAFGIRGRKADSLEAFSTLFREALDSRRPAILDCKVPKDAEAYW